MGSAVSFVVRHGIVRDLCVVVIAVALATFAEGQPLPGDFSTGDVSTGDASPEDALTVDRDPIDFNRDIRPLLSDKCFTCHGPDPASRKAELRLDTREGLFGTTRKGQRLIESDHPSHSALLTRIHSTDPKQQMPPPDAAKPLDADERALLTQWIERGARWSRHWSYVTPTPPELPAVQQQGWVRQPLDHFVLSKLEQAGMAPQREARKERLLRRVSFDLTGLPPTPAEVNEFLADNRADAYERQVDRLLASPRYGENMARYWLDAVRYGDTHGLHLDNERSIWPFRDWVIRAFNDNLPFDQFTLQQLAGDLLPDPSRDQLVATGYLRCHVTTNEGGTIPEEAYVRNVVDRVETTATVWLGMTAACASCHDHKYDPLTQKEFYQLFAFFNSGLDPAMDLNAPTPGPVIEVPSAEIEQRLAQQESDLVELRAAFSAADAVVDQMQQEWHQEWYQRLGQRWQTLPMTSYESEGGATFVPQQDQSLLLTGTNPDQEQYDLVATTDFTNIVCLKLDALSDPSLPKGGTSRASHGNFVLSEVRVEAVSVLDPNQRHVVEWVAACSDYDQPRYPVAYAIDGKTDTGWAMDGRTDDHFVLLYAKQPFGFEGGTQLHVTLEQRFGGQHNLGRIRLSVTNDGGGLPAAFGVWRTVGPFVAESAVAAFDRAFAPELAIVESKSSIDFSRSFEFTPLQHEGKPNVEREAETLSWVEQPHLVDGRVHRGLPGSNCATYVARCLYAATARQLELSLGSDDGLQVWLNGENLLRNDVPRGVAPDQERLPIELRAGNNVLVLKINNRGGECGFYCDRRNEDLGGVTIEEAALLANPPGGDDSQSQARLQRYFRTRHSERYWQLDDEISAGEEALRRLQGSVPKSLIMREAKEPKPAFLLERGLYDQSREQVQRELPAFLPPLPQGAPRDRLGFAQWLLDPRHPLTARVTVNRLWQQFFGQGLVKTAEDFGAQGGWPSHPQLLDWLATEFIDSSWDVKALQRRLVTSATYRQSADTDERRQQLDPANRLLSRGPRFRLDAEVIRDSALAMSGLLVEEQGGPGVRPYQPSGLWKAVAYPSSNTAIYQRDQGVNLYRRSIYTFWKRTSPPPNMTVLDAPTRESCTVRRSRTNTPTAALTLMNDVQFVEAARKLAERVLSEPGSDLSRMQLAFLITTSRKPDATELKVLEESLTQFVQHYQAHRDEAEALLQVGESVPDASFSTVELAAWTMLANLLLNLDETLSKG